MQAIRNRPVSGFSERMNINENYINVTLYHVYFIRNSVHYKLIPRNNEVIMTKVAYGKSTKDLFFTEK